MIETADNQGGRLDDLRFSVVGPGRVGRSLARWLIHRGAQLQGVASRRPGDVVLGHTVESVDTFESGDRQLLLVSVPDPVLDDVVQRLANHRQAGVVLHTAGGRGTEALDGLRRHGSEVGALHPLRAFPSPLPDPRIAAETFFALTGTSTALDLAWRLVRAFGARGAVVPDAQRRQYHTAATIAAGGTATLLDLVVEIGASTGLPSAVAKAYRDLAVGALDRIVDGGAAAITGPVARGETRYLERLEEVGLETPETRPLLVLLALESLRRIEAVCGRSPDRTALRNRLLEVCRQTDFLDPVLRSGESPPGELLPSDEEC